ncbi:MAG: hypothetical protein WC852_04080 [Candidatus Nanoarchaeia archaeon]|jgi:hypothetical protein
MVLSPEALEKRVSEGINKHFRCMTGKIDRYLQEDMLEGNRAPFQYVLEDDEVPEAIRARVFRKIVKAYSDNGWNARCEAYIPGSHLFTFKKKQ